MDWFRASNKAALALALVLPLMVGACASDGVGGPTASVAAPSEVLPASDAGKRQFTELWGRRFDADPADKSNALNYARGLRALTQYAQAVAVLQQAAIQYPNDLDILGAYGKALADSGRLGEAADVLSHAHTPDRPNWSILSAQGVVADQMGDHATAQGYYQAALKIVPGEASVLSNLGLSYALDKQLALAEQTMRKAVASPRADERVRRNFALVPALEGKSADAKDFAGQDAATTDDLANAAPSRQMSAQSGARHDMTAPFDPTPRALAALAPND